MSVAVLERGLEKGLLERRVTELKTASKWVLRGEVYFADLGANNGSIQGGIRPVLILQNDIGNRFSPTVIVVPLSSQIQKAKLPTHVILRGGECGLNVDSYAMLEQIITLNKTSLMEKVARLTDNQMKLVESALQISMGLTV